MGGQTGMNRQPRSGIGMTSQRTRDRLVQRLQKAGITDPAVLAVMRSVPRHLFVDEALASRAYEDTALPIGHGQTISQPYVVASMTEALLAGGRLEKVLEIGAGCGYQTAVLAQLVGEVYGIERIAPLLQRARILLRELGIYNLHLKVGDGVEGWKRSAPFDGIIVAAAAQELPEELLLQLGEGGRMVIPVTSGNGAQELLRVTRRGDEYHCESLGTVRFVPLVRG